MLSAEDKAKARDQLSPGTYAAFLFGRHPLTIIGLRDKNSGFGKPAELADSAWREGHNRCASGGGAAYGAVC